MDTKKLRQKILDLAIRGKLVPQDPNDEPASVLLERIRAEKERLIAEGKIKRSKKSKSSSSESHYQQVEHPFEIPESWEWVRLGDISNFGECTTVPVSNILENEWILELEDIEKDSAVILQTLSKKDRDIKGVRHKFNKNEILYSKLRTYLNKVLVAPQNGYCTTEIIPFKVFGNISPYYINTVLRSQYFLNYTLHCGYGMKMPRLSTTDACNGLLPLPSEKEQVRIGETIHKWFKVIDQIENDQSSLQTSIQNIRSKILELAMQGKLVPQDPTDEPAAEMLKRINPKATIITDTPHYPQLPDNWVYVALEDIVDYEQPQPYIVSDTTYSDDYATPVLTAGKSFILGYTNEKNGIYSKLPVIIFDDFTTDSRIIDFPFKVKSSAMKILSVKEGINIQYVAAFMSITRLIGETHKRYWISEYSKLPIPLPPIAEQTRVIEAIQLFTSNLDSIQRNLN